MSKNKVRFSIEEFKYPSSQEYKICSESFPKIKFFDFKYSNPISVLLNQDKSLERSSQLENLYWWNHCLRNRYNNLHSTYVYTITSYNRKFADDYLECIESEIVNHLQFDYYSEVFYYFLISVRDIIAQIINIYFHLKRQENRVHFDKSLIKLIPNQEVKEAMEMFLQETENASDLRNGFAHRFTPSINDLRTKFELKEGKETLSFGGGNSPASIEIIDKMNNSLTSLTKLVKNLKKNMKQTGIEE